MARIDEIDLDQKVAARELIDRMRARTFRGYPGTFFRQDGRKVYLRLTLMDEEDLAKEVQ